MAEELRAIVLMFKKHFLNSFYYYVKSCKNVSDFISETFLFHQ